VNDAYGHPVGDFVLARVAEIFSEVTRDSDVLARWGGEEFLILFRDVDESGLGEMAQRLLEALKTQPIQVEEGIEVRITCSVGYSHFPNHIDVNTYSWEDVVKIADGALYLAKQSGRDRSVGLTYNPEIDPGVLMSQINKDVHAAMEKGYLIQI